MAMFFTADKNTPAIGMNPIRGKDDPRYSYGWTGELGYRGPYGLTLSHCYCITKGNAYRIDEHGYGIGGDYVQYIGQKTPEYCQKECRTRCNPCTGRYYYLSSELFKQ